MDAVEAFQQSWVRAGRTMGITIDPETLPDMRFVRQAITEFNTWMQRVGADHETWSLLTQLDLANPQLFAYTMRQAGFFSTWPAILEHWTAQQPFITTWHNMVNVAVTIYQTEIRPHASADDIQMFQELDQIMATP